MPPKKGAVKVILGNLLANNEAPLKSPEETQETARITSISRVKSAFENESLKYIFVSGGVISGLGKGITAASLAMLLKSHGLRVTSVKIDMYLNIDAGTIRPQEHGEVFVTVDGEETDQDIGHYERFLGEKLSLENYITTGQIYQEVIRKERAFEYDGEDVEAIPHVTDEIIRRINLAAAKNKAEVVIVELGGTAGELQNGLFFEANRILKLKKPENVLHIHVVYVPFIQSLGELKSKPAQTSVHILNSMGIQPDFLVARAEKSIDQRRLERLAVFCNVHHEDIINAPDLESIYDEPLIFAKQRFSQKIIKKLGLPASDPNMTSWQKLTESIKNTRQTLKIAVIGKYFATGDYTLCDSYVSVVEALRHAGWANGVKAQLSWIDSDKIEKEGTGILESYQGIVVPGGFGKRGTEGMIAAVEFARKRKIPYLGLCYGMQMAAVEFARNVLKHTGANTTEVDPVTDYPVIHIMPDQEKKLLQKNYGGTMRLGGWVAQIKNGTLAERCYLNKADQNYYYISREDNVLLVEERHRHRYEFNNQYLSEFEENGLVASGVSPDGQLVEVMELKDHPFFLGTQFHPEFQSQPLKPHPLFLGFIEACLSNTVKTVHPSYVEVSQNA